MHQQVNTTLSITALREYENACRPSQAQAPPGSKSMVKLHPQVGGLDYVIYTSLPEDDVEGLLHQGVAELEATRLGVIRTREGMVTEVVHGCQATRHLKSARNVCI